MIRHIGQGNLTKKKKQSLNPAPSNLTLKTSGFIRKKGRENIKRK